MKNSTKVSIIIPTFNSEIYLERCLDSILRQTYKNFETIIVDGGSIDKTCSIIKNYCNKDNRFFYFKLIYKMFHCKEISELKKQLANIFYL